MGNYLVRVHVSPPNVTVPVATFASEYEIEAASLAEACEMVFDKPLRVAPPVTRNVLQNPSHRDYVAPDRSRFHAVADFFAGSRDSLEAALKKSGAEVATRVGTALAIGREYGMGEEATVSDCVTLVDSWDDRSADHVGLMKAWVENEWFDEEGLGRTWFGDLHERLAKAKVDGPLEREAAEEAYWTVAREIVAGLDAGRDAAPGPA